MALDGGYTEPVESVASGEELRHAIREDLPGDVARLFR